MNLSKRLADMVGLALVHCDERRGLVCFWNGSKVFLEYHVDVSSGTLVPGDSWTTSKRPSVIDDALAVARTHYGLSRD